MYQPETRPEPVKKGGVLDPNIPNLPTWKSSIPSFQLSRGKRSCPGSTKVWVGAQQSGVRVARCSGTRVRARAFDRSSFDAHACPLRCRCAVPRGSGHVSGLVLSAAFLRGNGVTRRTQKVIQGGDNGHVGRPCEVSPAPPCQELFCELRGLCRHSYSGPRTCDRSEKPRSSKWRGPNPGFQRNPSPP